jgi:Multimeric flavodoxin WrbA
MKVIAFNGSPRKEWNTATLLKDALGGAASRGAETALVHLYDLDYKGCVSCFSCKLKGGKSYGHCAHKDGLTPILDGIEEADAIIFGSPIYLGDITGEMKSCIERLVYPYLPYVLPPGTLFPKKIKTAFIFTMGVPEDGMEKAGYKQRS